MASPYTLVSGVTLSAGNTLTQSATKTAVSHMAFGVEVEIVNPSASAWAVGTTYANNAVVVAQNPMGVLQIYVSTADGNLGNSPATSPNFWSSPQNMGEIKLYINGSSSALTAANAPTQLQSMPVSFYVPAVSGGTYYTSYRCIIPGTNLFSWYDSRNINANFLPTITVIATEIV